MAFVLDGVVGESATFDMITECKGKFDKMESDSPTSVSTKLSDEAFSTDAEDDSTNSSFPPSDDETSSQGELSDYKLSDYFVYPITVMLQLRAVCLNTPSNVRYSTRPVAEVSSPKAKSNTPNKHAKLTLLEATTNSWAAQQRAAGDRGDDEKVSRCVRVILNKLTLEKFDELYEQLATCGVQTPAQLSMLMQEVFDKATQQHHFTEMYADLCMRLEADTRFAPARAALGESDTFRRLLLNQCQESFQSLLKTPAEDESGMQKQKSLGNIKLIALLVVRKMLNSVLLVECAERLLQEQATNPQVLEALAMLLTVAAPKFDRLDWQHRGRLGAVFAKVSDVTRDKSVPARLRFLLQDVLDLRKAGWTNGSQALVKQEAPKMLEEIRKQVDANSVQTHEQNCATYKSHQNWWQSKNNASQQGRWEYLNNKGWTWVQATNCSQQQQQQQQQQHQEESKKYANKQAKKWGKDIKTPKTESGKDKKKPCSQKKVSDEQKKQQIPDVVSESVPKPQADIAPAPESVKTCSDACKKFDPVAFRKDLSSMLRELTLDQQQMKTLTPGAAVKRIREHQVPKANQASEYSDLLTRAAEERNGAARRLMLALIVGLAANKYSASAFDRVECLEGIRSFFEDVYPDLCDEMPKLPVVATKELLPMLRDVFSPAELNPSIPQKMRSA